MELIIDILLYSTISVSVGICLIGMLAGLMGLGALITKRGCDKHLEELEAIQSQIGFDYDEVV